MVKNLTGSPINVWGTLYPLGSSGQVGDVEIPKEFFPPYATAELNLPPGNNLLDGAALKLESSGWAASFVATYVSHGQIIHMTRSMPFKDIGDRSNARGGYPWRLDGNYESHTYITNVGKVRAAYGAFIDPNRGERYVIDTLFLEPGETSIIDYRKLRDEKVADRNGVVISKTADSGEVQWFPLFFDGSQHFIGRTEVVDSSTGIASSFSCGSCPCNPNVNSAYTSPSSVTVSYGQTAPVLVKATMRDPCNINSIPDMTFIPTSWSVPPYFTMTAGSSPSTLKGVAPGSGLYITSFTTQDWVYNPFQNPQCSSSTRINTPEGTGSVRLPAQLLVIGDTTTFTASCPNTKVRILAYQVQDSTSTDIKSNILTREQFASKSANTCGTTITTSETCSGTPSGIIHDTLSVGCNSVGNGCGFTYTKQQWVFCNGGTSSVIGTVGDLIVHDNSISVGGSTASIKNKVIKP